MQISASIIEKSILLHVVESMHDTLTKMVSKPMFSRSEIRMNNIRNYQYIYLFRICKLASAIISNSSFVNIYDSMDDNEIKVVSTTTFSQTKIMMRQLNSYKMEMFLFYANQPIANRNDVRRHIFTVNDNNKPIFKRIMIKKIVK